MSENRTFILTVVITLSLLLPATVFSAQNYVAPSGTAITQLTGSNVSLAGNQCIACHGFAGPPLNAFGTDLQTVANNQGYGDGVGASWTNTPPAGVTVSQLFSALFTGVTQNGTDSDSDGYTNLEELTASSNPGDPTEDPTNVSGNNSGGGVSGDTEILSPRNTASEDSSSGTLSGCGNTAFVDDSDSRGSYAAKMTTPMSLVFVLMLPLLLLGVLRHAPARVQRRKHHQPTFKRRN